MTKREMYEARTAAYRKQDEVVRTLEKFADRTKFVDFVGTFRWYGDLQINLEVRGVGKVVKEMMSYIENLCPTSILRIDGFYAEDNYYSCTESDWDNEVKENDWDVRFRINITYKG